MDKESIISRLKVWWHEFRGNFGDHVVHVVGKSRENKVPTNRYPVSTNLAVIISLSLLLGGGFFGVGPFVGEQLNNLGALLVSLGGGETPKSEEDPLIKTPEKEADENCILDDEGWVLWLGEMNREINDDTHLSLPANIKSGLFKYRGDINLDNECMFEFVPRGEIAINYVVSFDDFYQLVIGNNDYWTVTLAATDVVGGPYYPIKEKNTGVERPRLISSIKKGSAVEVTIRQNKNDNMYSVEVTLIYTPDLSYKAQKNTETFTWEFEPSPILKLKPIDLSIGLIRGENDTSHIGVSFISPAPTQPAR